MEIGYVISLLVLRTPGGNKPRKINIIDFKLGPLFVTSNLDKDDHRHRGRGETCSLLTFRNFCYFSSKILMIQATVLGRKHSIRLSKSGL